MLYLMAPTQLAPVFVFICKKKTTFFFFFFYKGELLIKKTYQ